MMRPQWVALGIVLALVWSAVALAHPVECTVCPGRLVGYAGRARNRKVKGGCPGCGDE